MLSKQQFFYAAAFFLLGEDLKSCIDILARKVEDVQLALLVARLYQGDNGDMNKYVLTEFVIPLAKQNKDAWLESIAHWRLQQFKEALHCFLPSKREEKKEEAFSASDTVSSGILASNEILPAVSEQLKSVPSLLDNFGVPPVDENKPKSKKEELMAKYGLKKQEENVPTLPVDEKKPKSKKEELMAKYGLKKQSQEGKQEPESEISSAIRDQMLDRDVSLQRPTISSLMRPSPLIARTFEGDSEKRVKRKVFFDKEESVGQLNPSVLHFVDHLLSNTSLKMYSNLDSFAENKLRRQVIYAYSHSSCVEQALDQVIKKSKHEKLLLKTVKSEMEFFQKESEAIDLEMKSRVAIQNLLKLCRALDFSKEDWTENKEKLCMQLQFLSKALKIEESTLRNALVQYCAKLYMIEVEFLLLESALAPFFLFYTSRLYSGLELALTTYYPIPDTQARQLAKLALALFSCLNKTQTENKTKAEVVLASLAGFFTSAWVVADYQVLSFFAQDLQLPLSPHLLSSVRNLFTVSAQNDGKQLPSKHFSFEEKPSATNPLENFLLEFVHLLILKSFVKNVHAYAYSNTQSIKIQFQINNSFSEKK